MNLSVVLASSLFSMIYRKFALTCNYCNRRLLSSIGAICIKFTVMPFPTTTLEKHKLFHPFLKILFHFHFSRRLKFTTRSVSLWLIATTTASDQMRFVITDQVFLMRETRIITTECFFVYFSIWRVWSNLKLRSSATAKALLIEVTWLSGENLQSSAKKRFLNFQFFNGKA